MIHAYAKSVSVLGAYYDRFAMNFFSAAGNFRMAVYDESGGNPNNIIPGSESSSVAATTGYDWKTNGITEYQIEVSTVYIADQLDSASADVYRNSSVARRTRSQSYGVFTTGAFGSDTASGLNMKIGHS